MADKLKSDGDENTGVSRRSFLKGLGVGAVAAGVGSTTGMPLGADDAHAAPISEWQGGGRVAEATAVRRRAASMAARIKASRHRNNGEEEDYPYVATYTKGLEKDLLGEVTPAAYKQLRRAIRVGTPAAFEQLELAGKKLKNPLAGLSYDLQGPDAGTFTLPPAPRIDSAEGGGEMVELYWEALCKDINFIDYDTDLIVAAACGDLSSLSEFTGPTDGAAVTPATIFRGSTAGDLVGPYVSQFLLKDILNGSLIQEQKQKTVVNTVDFMTSYGFWLHRQNGRRDSNVDVYDDTHRYIRNGRDLANFVHYDRLFPYFVNAGILLFNLEAPLDGGNPYVLSQTMDPFGTFGYPHVLSLVAEVVPRALRCVWHQKWWVHRRARPEEIGGRVHHHLKGNKEYPLHTELLNSSVISRISDYNLARNSGESIPTSTYLLPQVYPEAAPLHPAYASGHATVAGACATILKAFFEESTILADPVVPNSDGTALVPYTGAGADQMTVGGELNKLAANIAMGRVWAGIHYRSDAFEGMKLGEKIAIQILKEQNIMFRERNSFTLTKFDGTTITIGNR